MAIGDSVVNCSSAQYPVSPLPQQVKQHRSLQIVQENLSPYQSDSLCLSHYLPPSLPRRGSLVTSSSTSLLSMSSAVAPNSSKDQRATTLSNTAGASLIDGGSSSAVGRKKSIRSQTDELLYTEPVMKVLEMGFSKEIVEAAIQLKVTTTGESYDTADALLDAVMAYQSTNDSEGSHEKNSLSPSAETISISSSDNIQNSKDNLEKSPGDDKGNVHSESKLIVKGKKKTNASRLKEIKQKVLSEKGSVHNANDCDDLCTDGEGCREKSSAAAAASAMQSSFELKEENKKMKTLRLCKICQENEIRIVLLPCGHLISCSECISLLAKCTLCNQAVKGSIKVFLA